MGPPEIEAGAVEQGLYTWSKVTVDGTRGQGFAELSPGLQDCVEWLSSLDPGRFQPLAPELATGYQQPYEGWSRLVTVGSFQVGKVGFVYRKIARAGTDGHGRDRFVIHLLAGRRDEFGLANVSEDDPNWLTAADCPFDLLPRLSTLALKDLIPATDRHRCAITDVLAGQIAEAWMMSPEQLRWSAGPDEGLKSFTAALLSLVPTALWNSIDLDWRVGARGPQAHVTIATDVAAAPISVGGSGPALSECVFHRVAESAWADMPLGHRSWEAFLTRINDGRRSRRQPAQGRESQASPYPRMRGSRVALLTAIAKVAGEFSTGALSDSAAERVFRQLEGVTAPHGGWITEIDHREIRRLLGDISKASTLRHAASFLNEGSGEAEIATAWYETGLAALGVAVLERPGGENILRTASVDDPDQLHRLFAYLLRTDAGRGKLFALLHEGFGSTEAGRRHAISALRDTGLSPREIFEEVLLLAELPPSRLLDFMRENVDDFASWLRLADPYREALRLGISRRWAFPRVLRR